MPGLGELVVVLLIILILFGGTRVPEVARALGQAIKEFRKGMSESSDEGKPDDKKK